jgi:hypothetical protein
VNISYDDYMRTWLAGHFDNEVCIDANAWTDMKPIMRKITINVLQHQQRVMRDRARATAQPKGDQPQTPVDVVW